MCGLWPASRVMPFSDECETWPSGRFGKDQIDAAAGAFNKLAASWCVQFRLHAMGVLIAIMLGYA